MKQAALIVTLALVGFALALAAFIASRLSEEEIALLAGAACGIGVAMPLGLALGVTLARLRHHDREGPPTPHIIYVGHPAAPPASQWPPQPVSPAQMPAPRLPSPTPRSFNIIGQSSFDDEL